MTATRTDISSHLPPPGNLIPSSLARRAKGISSSSGVAVAVADARDGDDTREV